MGGGASLQPDFTAADSKQMIPVLNNHLIHRHDLVYCMCSRSGIMCDGCLKHIKRGDYGYFCNECTLKGWDLCLVIPYTITETFFM